MARGLAAPLAVGMETFDQPGGPARVWVLTHDEARFAYLSELVRLSGATPLAVPSRSASTDAGEGGDFPVGSPADFPADQGGVPAEERDVLVLDAQLGEIPASLQPLPRVTVRIGTGEPHTSFPHDVALPLEEEALLRLLSDMEVGEGLGTHAPHIALVCAWQGGGGSTTASYHLAAASGAVLVDAAGNYGGAGPFDGGLGWSDLNPGDLPPPFRLVAGLPRQFGVPILGPQTGLPVRASADVVFAVLLRATRDMVVDCGADLVACAALAQKMVDQGKRVSIITVGRANSSGVRALGQACAAGLVDAGMRCLLVGGAGRLFPMLAARYGLTWRRAPRAGSRRWQRIWRQLWER